MSVPSVDSRRPTSGPSINGELMSGKATAGESMTSFERSSATIAAWNLNGWGGIDHDRLDRQAFGLSLIDAEVITLVEVPSENDLSYLRDKLLTKYGLNYNAVYLEQGVSANHPLNIAVLHKQGITATNAEFIAGSDGGVPNARKALTVDINVGRLDFKLIAVHLKSGRDKDDQDKRDAQCKVIGDYITATRGTDDRDPDIILCGDFNMIPGQDISNFHHLGANDVMDFISSWDLQQRYSHILAAGRANLLDGFAIARRYSTEYIRGSLRLFPLHWNMNVGRERFRRDVSDHLPFVASFRLKDLD